MSAEPDEQIQLKLHDFAPDDWFENRETSKFWLRIRQVLFVARDGFLSRLEGATKTLNFERPVAFSYVVMGGLQAPQFTHTLHCRSDGQLELSLRSDNHDLRSAPYVVASTPYVTDGESENEYASKSRIDRAAAIIRAHIGGMTIFIRAKSCI